MSEKNVYGLFDSTAGTGPLRTWEADHMGMEGSVVCLYRRRSVDETATLRVAAITLKDGQHVALLDCVRGNDNLPSQSKLGPVLRK